MKRKKRSGKEKLRRGIYILPNIFTSLNIFCGFFAVIAAIEGNFRVAAISILIAGVFDLLDGKIARATHTSSKFGVEYDSLADLISFGMAPALLMYLWALQPLGRIGWLAAFLFMVCGALRLARFNTNVGNASSAYFVGLPIPTAGWMVAATILFCEKFSFHGMQFSFGNLILLYLLAFLMVSTIKYNSLKKPGLFKKIKFNVLVSVILILIFFAAMPTIALFFIGLIYILSGPFIAIWYYRRNKHVQPETHRI